MYDEILKYYNSLPSQYQTSLNSAYPDLVNTIAAKRKQLDSRELVILVAGKSTCRNDYTLSKPFRGFEMFLRRLVKVHQYFLF